MRLVTGLVKDRLLGCMEQVLTAGSLTRKGVRGGMENKVSYDKDLMEVGKMAEGDRGGGGKKVASGGIR